MKEKGSYVVTWGLYIVLAALLFLTGRAWYDYYRGPTRAVEVYIKDVQKGEYEKAYKLLNKESLDTDVSKKQLLAYYKQCYEKELIETQRLGKVQLQREDRAICKVLYTYKHQQQESQVSLVKKNNRWEVISPFKSSSVTIYAPAMSRVYIAGKEVVNQKEGTFVQEGILPGNYMIQVVFPEKKYKDYFQLIKVPEQTEIVLPYDVVNVSIHTVKGVEVKLNELGKLASKGKTEFRDILPGVYNLTIKSPYGTVEPINEQISIGSQSCDLNYSSLKLSKRGHEMWEDFVNDFYSEYLTSIERQNAKAIAPYFEGNHQKTQLSLFNDWFIKNKNIQDARLKIETKIDGITPKGYLQSEMMEIVELTNLEEVEEDKENKVYRLVLKWDTQIDIMKKDWQIANRTLKESIIAYQTEDGRWIQY